MGEYGTDRWENSLYPSLRDNKQEYACLLNFFAVAQDVMDVLGLNKEFFDMDKNSETDGHGYSWLIQHAKDLNRLGKLSLFSTATNNSLNNNEYLFPRPQTDRYQIKTHYMLDPSSLFPVEMLQIQTHHSVLDMCAAPGGKTLAISQLLFNETNGGQKGKLFANELDPNRRKRLLTVVKEYIPKHLFDQDDHSGNVIVTGCDGASRQSLQRDYAWNSFDRILVDACCSAERHLIQQPNILVQDWSIQHATVKKPKVQKQLLLNALELLKSGNGRLVYATCSINTAENDQVIQYALDQHRKNTSCSIRVIKPSFSVGESTKYGWIILPDSHPTYHWGPSYFCILEKTSLDK